MATNVGRAEIDVYADGKNLNRQMRRIAHKAGKDAGVSFDKGFNEGGFKGVFRNAEKSFANLRGSAKSTAGPLRRLNESWKSLGHNTRQWTLIIGSVLAGMQSMSVLSSALGGGLIVLGGALTGVVFGLGGAIAAFSGLAGDIDKIPAAVRPAAKAFQDLKTPLKELRDFLTTRAFSGAEGTFRSLGNTIRRLTPSFAPLADAIRGIVDDFAKWAESEEGISLISETVKNSAPIFDRVTRIIGRLAGSLLKAFNNPRVQKAIDGMLTGLEGLFGTFDKWVQSEEFTKWIDDSMFILGKLGDLISATSGMLSDLVTPEAIERTGKFLDNLTKFMPHLGELLDFLGRLDPFGLLAQALADIGEALSPLAEPFGRLADGLNRIVGIAIDEWAKNLKGVSEVLAPIFDFLADLVSDIPEDVIRAIADALFIFATALTAIKAVKFTSAVLGITGLFTALKGGSKTIKNFPLGKLKGIAAGLASFAAITLVELIPDDFWDSLDADSNIPKNVLTGAVWGSMFGAWGIAIGAGIGLVVSLFEDLEGSINDLSESLIIALSGAGLGGIFATFFANLVPEEWRTSENPFKMAMAAIAFVITDTGTAIRIMIESWDEIWAGAQASLGVFSTQFTTSWDQMWDIIQNPENWESVGSDIDSWWTGLKGDFSAGVADLGARWTTFWGNLGTIAAAVGTVISSRVKRFILEVSANIRNGLADARRGWDSFWSNLVSPVADAANRIASTVRRIIRSVQDALRNVGLLGGGSGGSDAFNGPRMASGGVLNGPRRILAGEDGPEAIVPLNRSLSRVDPSVRWLSALAQGKAPGLANGGVVGGGRTNIVEAGAIVVQEASDGLSTSVEILDRLARKLN